MSASVSLRGLRVGVVGGSIAGQLIAIKLSQLGATVSVFEKSSAGSFQDRGVGIGCPTVVMNALKREGLFGEDIKHIHCPVFNRIVATPEFPETGRNIYAQDIQMELLSWSEIFHQFSNHVPPDIIAYDTKVDSVGMNSSNDKPYVKLAYEDKNREFDLVVGCDGYLSSVRPFVAPSSSVSYAGYVLWRGYLTCEEMEKHGVDVDFLDQFYFVHLPSIGGHLIIYFVVRPDGSKILTWGLYIVVPPDNLNEVMTDKSGRRHDHSVPAGHLSSDVEERWKEMAREHLPTKFSNAIAATNNTFVQGIFDMDLASLVAGKIALTGDAGFVARPHTVAGLAKAYANANALVSALVNNNSDQDGNCDIDIKEALKQYDDSEVSTMHNAVALGQSLGQGTVLNTPADIVNWTQDDYKAWLVSLTNIDGKLNIYRS